MNNKQSKYDLRFASAPLPSMVLPEFPGGEIPEPESAFRKAEIRSLAIFTFALSVVYVVWRALFTVDLVVLYVSIPLLVAEAHNCVGFLLFTLALWDRDVSAPWHAVERPPGPERNRVAASRSRLRNPTGNQQPGP